MNDSTQIGIRKEYLIGIECQEKQEILFFDTRELDSPRLGMLQDVVAYEH